MPFLSLGLSDQLVRGILATGYIAPTEIQAQVIPFALAGKDILGAAQTGTGKTAAFVLPILNRLGHQPVKKHDPAALILTPTRELATQIEQCIYDYGRFMQVRTLAVYGGVNIDSQLKKIRRGLDIVVATPGRLLDHIGRKSISLSKIETLVIDEADRMFDMGFIRDVQKIIALTPKDRQTMLFSATISADVKKLVANVQKNPRTIQVGPAETPIDTISQYVYRIEKDLKLDLLLHLLKNTSMYSVMVFSRTKHGADRICRKLEKAGIKSVAIHSGRTQGQRVRAMEGFKAGKFQVMVCTDIAARGIDIEGVSHVINYDCPPFAEDYVHRIGRTGRAHATGDAITFAARDEHDSLRKIERFICMQIPLLKTPDIFANSQAAKPSDRKLSSDRSRPPFEAEPKPGAQISTQSRPSRRRRWRRSR